MGQQTLAVSFCLMADLADLYFLSFEEIVFSPEPQLEDKAN